MGIRNSWLPRDARGITGLETAIILIAFVVVASVFAFTVLSTGIFASERSKETVFAGAFRMHHQCREPRFRPETSHMSRTNNYRHITGQDSQPWSGIPPGGYAR